MAANLGLQTFSSTVIATIGRSSLAHAVESVLSQDVQGENFEVIVVNDSGRPLKSEEWQRCDRVRILETNRYERSVARNTGAAVARGEYLHFLDDDDWMLPGAFKELWALARATNASWVYGKTRFVNREGKVLSESQMEADGNVLVEVMAAGSWLPTTASLVKSRDFFKIGGFDPKLALCEDKDMCRRIALIGDFAHTSTPLACALIDRATSTSHYEKSLYYNQWSRDKVLAEKGSFGRMLASATTPFWRGRMIRVYLTGIVWNINKINAWKAARRFGEAFVTLLLSLFSIISPDFLHGIYWSNDRFI